jgi:hypothetical protein
MPKLKLIALMVWFGRQNARNAALRLYGFDPRKTDAWLLHTADKAYFSVFRG